MTSYGPMTEYVSTRWYRAPEWVLRSQFYNYETDIFALGWIFAELYTLIPIFPGESEIDQLFKLWKVLGTPSYMSWPEGYMLAENRGIEFPMYEKQDLRDILRYASEEAVELIEMMLNYNPKLRPSVPEILSHSFFEDKPKYPYQLENMYDSDTFDSLKIGNNGIQINKNQKFTGINNTRNNYQSIHSIMRMNRDALDEKIESEDNRFNQKHDDNSDHTPTFEPNNSDIDASIFPDSALLAHEAK